MLTISITLSYQTSLSSHPRQETRLLFTVHTSRHALYQHALHTARSLFGMAQMQEMKRYGWPPVFLFMYFCSQLTH